MQATMQATMQPRGTHRIEQPEFGQEPEPTVWVMDGDVGFEVRESDYMRRGYEPPLQSLPWGSHMLREGELGQASRQNAEPAGGA